MFENPRRGRQARNFTTTVPKILDLKSSSQQIFSETCRWVPLFLHCKIELFSHAKALLYTSNGEDLGVSLTCCGANGDVICYIRVRHGTYSIVDRRQAFKFCSRSPGAFIIKCIPWHAIHHFVWDTHQGWSFRLETSDCSKCHFGFKIAYAESIYALLTK